MKVIVTTPPYTRFLSEIAAHPVVAGFRLNTIMPTRGGAEEALDRLSGHGQPVWVDLKGRQLRVVGAAIPPFTAVELSHPLSVSTPCDAFFSDGQEHARIEAVAGNRIILTEGARRLIGPGESVNIPHPSLQIHGILTDTDKAYLAEMQKRGMKQVMLSYVEAESDVTEVARLLAGAEVVLKIETQRGLALAKQVGARAGRLMAARGDLFVEVERPHHILGALQTIIQADPQAIVASRILDSLARSPIPSSADISDIAWLLQLGYRTFMLGDSVCLQRDSVLEALNVLQAIWQDWQG
jgi:pyruvate kinase